MNSRLSFLLASVAAGTLFIAPADAQNDAATANTSDFYNRSKYVAVLDRSQPEFDPEPMRAGAFLLRPRLEASVASDSNVFSAETDEVSDTIVRVGGVLDARSDWNIHEVGVVVSGHQNEYLDLGDESNFDFRSRAFGALEATRDLTLIGNVLYEDRTEARTELSNSVSNDSPIQFSRSGAEGGVRYQNDRFRLEATADVSSWDYEDARRSDNGAVVDQDFRDHDRAGLRVRTSYAVNPNVAVYGQARTSTRDYDIVTVSGPTTFNRDTTGFDLQAGVDFELTSLIRGDIGVGYLEEDRDDPQLADIDGLSVDGRVIWFPTQLTTLTFEGSRRTQDQGIIQAPSAVTTSLAARVDHELRRNVILSAYGVNREFDFEDIDRTDEIAELGVEGTYKLNKRIHLQAFARLIDRESSGDPAVVRESFDKNTFGLRLQFFPY